MIESQWKVVEKLKRFSLNYSNENWKITYSTPVYGGWDLIIECVFATLADLETIISFCRTDNDLTQWIEATTTLISVRKTF